MTLFFLSQQASARMDECRHFESNWTNAVNMCKLAADAANSSGERNIYTVVDWKVRSKQISAAVLSAVQLKGFVCLQEPNRHRQRCGRTFKWHRLRWTRLGSSRRRSIRSWLKLKWRRSKGWPNMLPFEKITRSLSCTRLIYVKIETLERHTFFLLP